MYKKLILFFVSGFLLINAKAQVVQPKDTIDFVYDTFFLSKKKGWLGDLGRSLSADPPKPEVTKTGTIKNDLPFNKYKDFIINKIYVIRLDFNQDINDTSHHRRDLAVRIADALHTKTKARFIKQSLFFEEGDKLQPYLVADNERYLRTLIFVRDAKIVAQPTALPRFVDLYVYVKDNLSIGVSGNFNGGNNFDAEIKEENFLGNAQRVSARMLYDASRNPKSGFGGEFMQRNIWGSFTDFSIGFKAFNGAFSSGMPEESYLYGKFDRPLVSPYMPFTGNAEFSLHTTKNNYNRSDSDFKQNIKYQYFDFDGWGGFKLGSKKYLRTNQQSRLSKFFALRAFHKKFDEIPQKYDVINQVITDPFYINYINATGVLASINVFRQNFYKTKFVYGFGRTEDIPEGFNFSLIGGWTNLQNVDRPYYGLDFNRNFFSKKGNYYNYTFRLGGFINDARFDDINMLLNLEYFSILKHHGGKRFVRNFLGFGITHQIRPTKLTQRLFLNSTYGLPEFSNDGTTYQTRLVAKGESVLFNNLKILGFRFAPFAYLNMAYLVQPGYMAFNGDFFSSMGGGLRTRNEALIFGTIEARLSYFPRINAGMNNYRVDFKTDLKFTYNSTFIKRPDFVSAN